MTRVILAAIVSLFMVTTALAQDGARAFFLLPKDTHIISLTGDALHNEFGGSVVDTTILTPSYHGSLDLGGDAGAFLIGIPIGGLTGSLVTPGPTLEVSTEVAQGDLFIGGEWEFLGSPSLAPVDYAQFKPGLRAGVAAKLFLPTGDYDAGRPLNLGGNRWSLQASLPISYVLASSMIDPNLTTFELVPFVHFYGDNDDPVGSADRVSQQPVWGAEAHVTHNFSPMVWAAADAYYQAGGETSSDGSPDGNASETLAAGATLGLTLSPTVALRLSYSQQVYSSVADTSARTFEVVSAFSF